MFLWGEALSCAECVLIGAYSMLRFMPPHHTVGFRYLFSFNVGFRRYCGFTPRYVMPPTCVGS